MRECVNACVRVCVWHIREFVLFCLFVDLLCIAWLMFDKYNDTASRSVHVSSEDRARCVSVFFCVFVVVCDVSLFFVSYPLPQTTTTTKACTLCERNQIPVEAIRPRRDAPAAIVSRLSSFIHK